MPNSTFFERLYSAFFWFLGFMLVFRVGTWYARVRVRPKMAFRALRAFGPFGPSGTGPIGEFEFADRAGTRRPEGPVTFFCGREAAAKKCKKQTILQAVTFFCGREAAAKKCMKQKLAHGGQERRRTKNSFRFVSSYYHLSISFPSGIRIVEQMEKIFFVPGV